MMTDTTFDSHGTRCDAWHFTADSAALTNGPGRPCVVMAHGFGVTRDSGLRPFAERFASAGTDVLLFDCRGYGTSDGTLRQDVNHLRHRQDYHAAIAHARTLADVDPDRIVLWGSSYSGGHVIAVAAQDGRVAGVISQAAAMDGLAALLQIVNYAAKAGAGAGAEVLALTTGHFDIYTGGMFEKSVAPQVDFLPRTLKVPART